MSEMPMVEAVARAISGAPFSTASSRRKARAAIRAMREPSAEMMRSGMNAEIDTWDGRGKTCADDPRPIFHAMIDAALAAPDEGQSP